jgi:pyruvate dehydrogenase E1 component beta subunit
MPSTPYDAKGLLIAAINDPNPVIYIDDRWLYGLEEEVPEEYYEIPIGKGIRRRSGSDMSMVSISYMAYESFQAAQELEKQGIDVDLIDLRSLKPLDEEIILESVEKTGRLVVIDGGWRSFGAAAEISAIVAEKGFHYLKAPIRRITLPDIPAPASSSLEKVYYPTFADIVKKVKEMIN